MYLVQSKYTVLIWKMALLQIDSGNNVRVSEHNSQKISSSGRYTRVEDGI